MVYRDRAGGVTGQCRGIITPGLQVVTTQQLRERIAYPIPVPRL
jgi:hypothetical protein